MDADNLCSGAHITHSIARTDKRHRDQTNDEHTRHARTLVRARADDERECSQIRKHILRPQDTTSNARRIAERNAAEPTHKTPHHTAVRV